MVKSDQLRPLDQGLDIRGIMDPLSLLLSFVSGSTFKSTVLNSHSIIISSQQMNSGQSQSDNKGSSGSQEAEGSSRRRNEYVPGACTGKWSQEEHMRYIVFIDGNKQRMRSKEKRHSNKFYAEMARFIGTRNALQCRSHHQKLEEKYCLPQKIVAVYKHVYDRMAYREAMGQLAEQQPEEARPWSTKPETVNNIRPQTVDAEVQTQIMGVNLQFVMMGASTVMVSPPSTATNLPPPMHHQLPLPPYPPYPGAMGGGFGWWGHYQPPY